MYNAAFCTSFTFMIILAISTVALGAAFLKLDIFLDKHVDSLKWLRREIMAGMVLYAIFVFLFISYGIGLLRYPPRFNNIATAIFGLMAMFFGFIPLMFAGTALLDFTNISNKDMHNECGNDENGNPIQVSDAAKEDFAKRHYLMEPYIYFANVWDKKTEKVLEKVMCTDICPCYKTHSYV